VVGNGRGNQTPEEEPTVLIRKTRRGLARYAKGIKRGGKSCAT